MKVPPALSRPPGALKAIRCTWLTFPVTNCPSCGETANCCVLFDVGPSEFGSVIDTVPAPTVTGPIRFGLASGVAAEAPKFIFPRPDFVNVVLTLLIIGSETVSVSPVATFTVSVANVLRSRLKSIAVVPLGTSSNTFCWLGGVPTRPVLAIASVEPVLLNTIGALSVKPCVPPNVSDVPAAEPISN